MFANFDFTVDLTDQVLFRRLAQIGLDRDHFAIFGSAPLFVRGILPDIQDLDIVARDPAWSMANRMGVHRSGTLSSDPIIHFWGGRIEIFREWLPPYFDTDKLIDDADEYGGFRFVQPECVVTYKSILNRPKDIVHLEILRELVQVHRILSQ